MEIEILKFGENFVRCKGLWHFRVMSGPEKPDKYASVMYLDSELK